MATFEQALNKAFEVTWQHSEAVDEIREEKGRMPEDHIDQLHVASVEEKFIGSVDVLGSLLLLDGRIPAFTPSVEGNTPGWVDGSTATLTALVAWAHENKKMTDAEYAAWNSIQAVPAAAFQRGGSA